MIRWLPLFALLALPAAAEEARPQGNCGREGWLTLDRVQAERRSDGQWNILLHIRNTTGRPILFTLSLRVGAAELARVAGQPYRVNGGAVLMVPTGPSGRPVPTAEVLAGLRLNCPS
jgi:hypothetical protein